MDIPLLTYNAVFKRQNKKKKKVDANLQRGNFWVNKSRGHCFLFPIYTEQCSSDTLVDFEGTPVFFSR